MKRTFSFDFLNLIEASSFCCNVGIASLLPPSIQTIRNKEGVHGAISFCFRTTQSPHMPTKKNEKATDDIDLAFDALKKLNLYGQKLTERYNQRVKNSSPEVYSKVVFNIGQVVSHKESCCRCVVTGTCPYRCTLSMALSFCIHFHLRNNFLIIFRRMGH
jgi:hypothetical protein